MDKQTFIRAIKRTVRDAAIGGSLAILRKPPGRKPDPRLIRLAEWFNSLPPEQQDNVAELSTLATDQAVFGFLCVLDGVRQIEDDPDKGRLVLNFEKHGNSLVLNDGSEPELHDLFKAETAR